MVSAVAAAAPAPLTCAHGPETALVSPFEPEAAGQPWQGQSQVPRLAEIDSADQGGMATSEDAGSGAAATAEESALAERLAKLEEDYAGLKEDYEKLSEDQDALKDDLQNAATSGHGGATMQINGRIHFDHWGFPGDSPGVNAFENGDPAITPQDRLELRRLRLAAEGDLWENMEYCLDMEFSGGVDPEFRDVFIGVKDLPVLRRVLIGNQKRPYGLDHINSSRYNIFLERPFIVEALNQDNRRLGVQSWGHSEDLYWNWRYGIFNQRLVQDEGVYLSDHYQPELTGRLSSTFFYQDEGLNYGHWAVAGSIADPDASGLPGRAANEARFRTRPEARTESRWLDTGVIAGTNDYGLLALENVWNFGPLQVVGEYQSLWLDRDAPADLHFHGGYFYVSYTLTGEHIPWDRETGQLGRLEPFTYVYPFTRRVEGQRTGWGAWQVAYRASYGDLSDEDVLGGIGRAHSAAVLWYWNPWAKMVFNVISGEIEDHAPVAGQSAGNYTAIGTRFMVDF
ncbi:MAG: porin [Planctomycetota bacterium]|nr:MAG: porin [Planctomycetota bacterium]